jgi:diguanylate cyclase (GGDEF)-like protein
VRDKFSDYEELMAVSMIGEPLVSSSPHPPLVSLPDRWFENLQDGQTIVAAPYWDPNLRQRVITLAEVVKSADNRPLGLLTTKIGLRTIWSTLKRQTTEGINDIYLIDDKGKFLLSGTMATDKSLPSNTVAGHPDLAGMSDIPVEYTNFRDLRVVGLAVDIPTTGWRVVTETRKDSAYAGMFRLGKITAALVAVLMLTMSILAYYLGRTIVKPLRTLGRGARKIATGNLDVEVPVRGNNEVSYLTQVFNHMAASLRQDQADISLAQEALIEKNRELHEQSITDGLTGLFNRKQIMDLFDLELTRTLRYGTPFSILIADIDHFKQINDTYGHLAGDAVLRRMADTLRQAVRECDHVGRYGGEEFLIILPNTESDQAIDVAQRIRKEISRVRFHNDGRELSLTISVGLSQCTDADDSAETVLGRADTALYHAKESGRNQVIEH